MNARPLYLVLASLMLTSCAAVPPEFGRMSDASGQIVFALDQGVQVKSGPDPIYLASGSYRITKAGPQGAMYVGSDFGVIRLTARGYLGYPGGVWIPRDPNAMAKVVVFANAGERLYGDLSAALALPAENERKMAEQALLEGIDYAKIQRRPCDDGLWMPPPGVPVGWASVALICALIEGEWGKPEFIAELPRKQLEELIGPSSPAQSPP